MNFKEWGRNIDETESYRVHDMYADWKRERTRLVKALEKAEKLLMEVDGIGCADANATGLAYCGKCLSCQANDLAGEIDFLLDEIGREK